MRAIELTGFGGTEVLKMGEAEVPRPSDGEVLIRVAAAGVNRADLLQRQGHYPPPPGAGERWNIGDKVCALLPGGGYAEYCVAHEGCCLPVAENLDLTEAAALPEA